MGYQTTYRLECDAKNKKTLLRKIISANEYMGYALSDDGSPNESCKWYEHEDDMREISRTNPGVLFTLHGEGEESGDIWRKYFLDGKMQVARAIVAFESFDPQKLE